MWKRRATSGADTDDMMMSKKKKSEWAAVANLSAESREAKQEAQAPVRTIVRSEVLGQEQETKEKARYQEIKSKEAISSGLKIINE